MTDKRFTIQYNGEYIICDNLVDQSYTIRNGNDIKQLCNLLNELQSSLDASFNENLRLKAEIMNLVNDEKMSFQKQ